MVVSLAKTDPIGRISVLVQTYQQFKGPIDVRLVQWLLKIGEGFSDRDLRFLLDKVPEYHLHSLADQLHKEIASEDFRVLLPPIGDKTIEDSEVIEYHEPETLPELIEFIGIDPETQAEIERQMEAAA